MRKMQSTQGRRGKRKSALSSLERGEPAPIPLNLEAKLASGAGNPDDGSFAIADLANSRV